MNINKNLLMAFIFNSLVMAFPFSLVVRMLFAANSNIVKGTDAHKALLENINLFYFNWWFWIWYIVGIVVIVSLSIVIYKLSDFVNIKNEELKQLYLNQPVKLYGAGILLFLIISKSLFILELYGFITNDIFFPSIVVWYFYGALLLAIGSKIVAKKESDAVHKVSLGLYVIGMTMISFNVLLSFVISLRYVIPFRFSELTSMQ